ncbi:MAG TPA: MFS transporter [Blastocatellia bacterium]|nr:MFS transporter [Blastocatellia bacterium]
MVQEAKETEARATEQTAQKSGRIYYGWVIVAAGFAVISLISPLIASFPLFYVAVLQDFNWSRGSTAIAMSLHLVLGGLASPVAGGLIDRYGPRRVMPVGALITGAALVWLSQSAAMWEFYVGFGVVAAIGSSLLHVVPLTAVISNWFVRNRGTAIGIVTAGSGAGQLVLLPLLQYLISNLGWRNSYLALGIAILTIPSVLIWLFLYTRPSDRGLSSDEEMIPRRKRKKVDVVVEQDGQEIARKAGIIRKSEVIILDHEWAEKEWTVGKAVRTFRFWALTLVMAMFAAGFFLISVHLVAYLTDKRYSADMASVVVALQGFINIGGKFFGGFLCDRIGREKTLTLSIAVFVACIVLLNAGGFIYSPLIIYTFAVLYGMGYGMALPALMASASDLFQGRHFGAILGVFILGGYLGGALGTWMGGHFFDLTQAYRINFLVAALTMFISAALIWKARPGRVRLVRSVVTSE